MNDDPFDTVAAPTAADFPPTRRAWQRPVETCGLVGKPKRRKVDLNPHARRWFEREGYVYARVEGANAWAGRTKDLWGFGDYLCCRKGEIILVQVTTVAHAAEREHKARKCPELAAWLAAGGRFQIHAWRQRGGKGSKWEVEVREVRAESEGVK